MTNPDSPPVLTTPSDGSSVVKWYSATFGRAAETAARSEDLPADGRPTSPTSAIILSSSTTSFSSPGIPDFAKRGICLVGVAKCLFPQPPRPPRQTVKSPPSLMSWMQRPLSASLMSVPRGTLITTDSPSLPWNFDPSPSPPASAMNFLLYLNASRVLAPSSTVKTTSPPLPPSPPSGPPFATYFSRLNETAPLPPFPAFRYIFILSINNSLSPYSLVSSPSIRTPLTISSSDGVE